MSKKSIDWNKALKDYNKKYAKTYALKVFKKAPLKTPTVFGIKGLSKKKKFHGLLKRGMPSQHIPILLNLEENELEKILNEYEIDVDSFFFDYLNEFWAPSKKKNYIILAMASVSFHDWDEAQDTYEHILRRDNFYSPALFGLALCFDKKGDRNSAFEFYTKSYMVDPASFMLAMAILDEKKIKF
jgi:tetratricopeptide (TPR) repeat protein